jgi:Ni,Fe-hydrogenase I cytochrome b subunit
MRDARQPAGREHFMDILHDKLWAQGFKVALKAYTRASDAYAQDAILTSVAMWAVLIAAGIVLLEWVVARRVSD